MTRADRSRGTKAATRLGSAQLRWALALAVSMTVGSCNRTETTPAAVLLASSRPNILVVVVDACRADKLGCYGFERSTSPNIDALAADPDAVVFRQHYVQSTWTKPSTASLFTGRFVHEHGVVLGHNPVAGGRFRTDVLSEELETMAERFREADYATFAVLRNEHLADRYGFARGFATYDAFDYGVGDPQLVERFLAAVDRSSRRFFGYLHLVGCHHPFPLNQRDEQYIARYGFPYDESARRAAGVDFTVPGVAFDVRKRQLQLEVNDVRFLHLLYEARLRLTDSGPVARLLNELRRSGRYDDSLLILTADHGEELYDHRGYGHGPALGDEVIRVPLIVKFPKGRKPSQLARTVEEPTNSVDLLPSLLAFAGLPEDARLPGTNILTGVFPGFALSEIGADASWALIRDGYKLIESETGALLFHLQTDRSETHDLASAQPERVQSMRQFVEGVKKRDSALRLRAPTIETDLAPAAIEHLRQLGYLK
jgi:arylsulfatase A-like enzyme